MSSVMRRLISLARALSLRSLSGNAASGIGSTVTFAASGAATDLGFSDAANRLMTVWDAADAEVRNAVRR